jgi:F0F1-type ATP synthase assembly protein I
MEPVAPRSFPPVEAGTLLAVVTLVGVGAGALIGWVAGSFATGLIIGAVVGLPAGVYVVYRRYRHYFS